MNVQYRVQEPGGRRMELGKYKPRTKFDTVNNFETDQITFYVFDIKNNGQYFVQHWSRKSSKLNSYLLCYKTD